VLCCAENGEHVEPQPGVFRACSARRTDTQSGSKYRTHNDFQQYYAEATWVRDCVYIRVCAKHLRAFGSSRKLERQAAAARGLAERTTGRTYRQKRQFTDTPVRSKYIICCLRLSVCLSVLCPCCRRSRLQGQTLETINNSMLYCSMHYILITFGS